MVLANTHVALLASLLGLVAGLSPSALHARHIDASQLKKAYDYIVIGGGTAGLTIADRLSESPDYNVLVLEHGDFYNASDPFGDNRASRQYNITSVPQPQLDNRTVAVGIGNCVGGSSAINGMAVMRGTKHEYAMWAELGDEDESSWTWDGMLPYFRKAIHLVPPDPAFARDYNVTYDEAVWGQHADTHVYASYPGGMNPRIKTFYNALKAVPGVDYPLDGHAGSHGVFWYPVSVDPQTRQRSYARTGHWDAVAPRNNYHLLTGARANKILFDGDTASGVQFVLGGSNRTLTVEAWSEVVLAAGAIHTPQLLQLSGIGPAGLLREAGIRVRVDLPGVGANFQDHPIGPGVMFDWGVAPPLPPSNSTQPRSEGQGQGLVAFLSLPVVAPDDFGALARRYAQLDPAEYVPGDTPRQVLAGYRAQQRILARAMTSKTASFLDYIVAPAPVLTPINLHTASRGSVTLDVSNPQGEPRVDYRALSHPTDVDLMVAYIGFARRLYQFDGLAQYRPREVLPGAGVTSHEQLAAYIRRGYNPQGWHPIGTAAKMRRELGGVVDDELRVYGVEGLRVVDASIMPLLIGGTTQLTVYAIAEKAAAMIKETWEEDE